LRPASELASRVEDISERFSAYYGLFVGHLVRGESASLRETAELFLREATAQPNCPEALIAHRNSGTTCLYFGDFAGAHDHYQKSIELYDRVRHADFANRFGQDPLAAAEIYDALTLWVLGRTGEALPLADRALADAESAAHAPTMGFVYYFGTLLGLVRATPKQSRPVADCWPISCLDTISQPFGPAWRHFCRAGQGRPMVSKRRDSLRCDAVCHRSGAGYALLRA
jgi:tetratricopeptide (TPR) repeat protein